MKVKELMKKLKSYPENAEVIIDYDFYDGGYGWERYEECQKDIEKIYPLIYEFHPEWNEIHLSTYNQGENKI